MLEGDNSYRNRTELGELGAHVAKIKSKLQFKWTGQLCFIKTPPFAQIPE